MLCTVMLRCLILPLLKTVRLEQLSIILVALDHQSVVWWLLWLRVSVALLPNPFILVLCDHALTFLDHSGARFMMCELCWNPKVMAVAGQESFLVQGHQDPLILMLRLDAGGLRALALAAQLYCSVFYSQQGLNEYLSPAVLIMFSRRLCHVTQTLEFHYCESSSKWTSTIVLSCLRPYKKLTHGVWCIFSFI